MTENTTASGAANTIFQAMADRAYCNCIEQLRRDECLGWEHKVKTGKFGEVELKAHKKAAEYLGAHRAFSEAAKLIAASAPVAPTQPDWRELCRRLYVELFHCDKQMTCSLNEDGEPIWRTGPEVRDVLSDAKAALEANPITPEAAPVAPAPQPAPVKIVRDFRWDSAQQHHVPTLLLEFEPVPANSPIDAKGWNDRDDVAIMLAASFRCAP